MKKLGGIFWWDQIGINRPPPHPFPQGLDTEANAEGQLLMPAGWYGKEVQHRDCGILHCAFEHEDPAFIHKAYQEHLGDRLRLAIIRDRDTGQILIAESDKGLFW